MRKQLWGSVLACMLFTTGASAVLAAQVTKWFLGSPTTLLSTELNSLANNGFTAASATYNNTVGGGGGDGSVRCLIEGSFTFVAAPTPNSAVFVWFLKALDDTNFENTPTTSISLGRGPDVTLPVTGGQTSTRVSRLVECPPGLFKTVATQQGTGQAMAASGNTIKIRPVTIQGVSQ